MPRLDPTLDLVFKLLLTREPVLLVDMLQGILDRPIRGLTLCDPTIPGEAVRDKQIILDIHAILDDGTRIDLEMQRQAPPELPDRLVFYTSRNHSKQLHRGDSYHSLAPSTEIIWLVEPLFPEIDRLHLIFELREHLAHTRLSKQIAIHLLQLSAPPTPQGAGADARVQRWARFFTAKSDADFERLASEDPIMQIAVQTLDHLSLDPQARDLARKRADDAAFYQMSLHASEARGQARGELRGEVRGKAQLLLALLERRFGPLPEPVRARVEAATSERLDAWAERVLTAPTLQQVFAP